MDGRLLFPVADNLRRGSYCNCVFGDVFGDYAVSSDYRSPADSDSRGDNRVYSYPAILPYGNIRAAGALLAYGNIASFIGVSGGDYVGIWRDPGVAAYCNLMQTAAANSARADQIYPVTNNQSALNLAIIYAAVVADGDRSCPGAETHAGEVNPRAASYCKAGITQPNKPYFAAHIHTPGYSKEKASFWPCRTAVNRLLSGSRLIGHCLSL